jgi:hypothetical protein
MRILSLTSDTYSAAAWPGSCFGSQLPQFTKEHRDRGNI